MSAWMDGWMDAKNYCNRTLIVKAIVENVVTCFLGDTVYKT